MSDDLDGQEARERAVWLELSSFRGISLGAVHFYGSLRINHGCCKIPCGCTREFKVELKRTLTTSQAKELTKIQNDNSLFGADHRWEKGDKTSCFDSKDDVIALALKTYQEIFPDKTLLLLGNNVYVYPEAILHDALGKYPVGKYDEPD